MTTDGHLQFLSKQINRQQFLKCFNYNSNNCSIMQIWRNISCWISSRKREPLWLIKGYGKCSSWQCELSKVTGAKTCKHRHMQLFPFLWGLEPETEERILTVPKLKMQWLYLSRAFSAHQGNCTIWRIITHIKYYSYIYFFLYNP